MQDERDRKIADLTAEVAALRAIVAELRSQVEELKAKLSQSSSNSNRPPSSDSPGQHEARPGKAPTGRRAGGQPGHKGWKRTLLPAEKVNRTQDCYPPRCRRRGCGRRLPRRPLGEPIRHQVVEVPAIEPHVAEYRLFRVACDCGKVTCAPLPDGVPRGMCGPRLIALIALLTGVCRNGRRDAVKLLGDVLGIHISLGALSEAEARVSEAIAVPGEEARIHASEQTTKNVDATSWWLAGKGRTLWTISTALVTFFGITADASRAGLRGLFAAVRGILVTDRGTQFGFWAMQDRQICWAHLIRKFAAFAERSGPAGELGTHLLLALRIFVLWRKTSFGSQSERGLRFAAQILTVAQTLRKQRRHVLVYLTQACPSLLSCSARPPGPFIPPGNVHPVNGYKTKVVDG